MAAFLFALACFVFGSFMFFALAAGKDSVPGASIFDSEFVMLYVVCGGLILASVWVGLVNFGRAFGPGGRQNAFSIPRNPTTPQVLEGATPDDRLAHLVQKGNRDPKV